MPLNVFCLALPYLDQNQKASSSRYKNNKFCFLYLPNTKISAYIFFFQIPIKINKNTKSAYACY